MMLLTLYISSASADETVLMPAGSSWRLLDTGIAPDPSWTLPGYDDSSWVTGPAPLGYGLFGIVTTVSSGSDPLNKPITTWFRAEITVDTLLASDTFALKLRRDDGAVVYLNGAEVARVNLPAGIILPSTLATVAVSGGDQDTFFPLVIPSEHLVEGSNLLAIELHQQSPSSPDLVMDASLSRFSGAAELARGPYLQQLAPDGVIVRWATTGPSTGRVYWQEQELGPYDPFGDAHTVDDETLGFEHSLRVTGAPPNTEIAYAIGSSTPGYIAGGDSKHVFRTAPLTGKRTPVRIWVISDSGTANADAEAVRDAYTSFSPDPLETDLWLMLGDNAYNSGTIAEYDAAVFGIYPDMLRQVVLWPAIGNHDGYSSFSDTQTGPFFDLFDLPSRGEVGGLASGTEAYWSFDYANIHFVCLDSYHSDRSATGAMVTWLTADLAATDADFLITFFHHPPYSKGSHNSDIEIEMVEMREEVLPVLEASGVDLVLTGHSHSYERSFLLDGHYGSSDTFDPATMILQDQDGNPASGGAYTKWPVAQMPHEGTVYVVSGSSGQVSGGALDHPAMLVGASVLGSLVLDIDGLSLTGSFLDDLGNIADTFTIHKGQTTIVSIAGPRVAFEDESIDFIALARQPDGTEPPSYRFDWGDGSPQSDGPAASHSWPVEGSYTLTVSVTDDAGIETSKDITVYIDNSPPIIDSISVSPGAVEGSVVTFTASASDPGGDPVSYLWEIDGELYDTPIVEHLFYDDGLFTAQLAVQDGAGRETIETIDVLVSNVPPVLTQVTQSGDLENEPIFLIALGYDPGFDDIITTTWTLPDGTQLTSPTTSLTVADDIDQVLHVRLEDDDGGVTEQDVLIDVDNQPPVLSEPQISGTLAEGEPITFTATATDPSPLDTPWVSWSFDGGASFVTGEEVTHIFGDQGPHTVFVAATDEDAGFSLSPIEVSLENLPASIDAVLAPGTALEGAAQSFSVLGHDPGYSDVLSATWTFGDGEVEDGLTVTHALPDDGVWLVSVSLTDDEGEGESISFSVQANNVAPRFLSTPELRISPDETFTYAPIIEDVDPVTLALVGPATATLESGIVRFRGPVGTSWPMTLTADDGDGGVTSQSWSVAVADDVLEPAERFEREDLSPCGCRSAPHAATPLAIAAMLVRRRRREPGTPKSA